MIYHLGLLLAKRERHCAADFCLLVVCILAGYDPFIPVGHTEGEEKSRKHIGLVHSGSHLLNRVDGLSGTAGFSFTDLHATDIFDYALRLGNNNVDSPLAKSSDYQLARIEYAKKLSSYGGFATDAFRYCTEVARSLWVHIANFDKAALFDLCDLADSLQYVAAAMPAEIEWIASLRMMLDSTSAPASAASAQDVSIQNVSFSEEQSLTSEAQKWHDDHQAPIEISNKEQYPKHQEPIPVAPPGSPPSTIVATALSEQAEKSSSSESYVTTAEHTVTSRSKSATSVVASSSKASTIPDMPPIVEKPVIAAPVPPPPPTTAPPPVIQQKVPEKPFAPPVMSMPPPTPQPPIPTPPPAQVPAQPRPQAKPQPQPIPIPIVKQIAASVAKSPRAELDDLWASGPPIASAAAPPPVPTIPAVRTPPASTSAPVSHKPKLTSKPSVPNTKTAPPPAAAPEKQDTTSLKNDRKASKGWFGSIKEKVIKSIPSSNQMILPDDSKPSIVWDPVKKRYVGAGVEEEVVAAPPPVMSAPHLPGGGADSNKSSTNSLRSARSGVGSRYLQAGMATSQTPAPNLGVPSMMPPTMMPPMMQMPTSFGFIPAATEDLSESETCRKSFLGAPKRYCSSVSQYANQSCPTQSLPAYLIIIEYFVILKLLLWPILFAFFSKTAKNVDDEADKIWRFQLYSLAEDFRLRPPLPPPLTILCLICSACCRFSDSFSGFFSDFDHPDFEHRDKNRATWRFGSIYHNPSVPFNKNVFVTSFWRKLSMEQWKNTHQKSNVSTNKNELQELHNIHNHIRMMTLRDSYEKSGSRKASEAHFLEQYPESGGIMKINVKSMSKPWSVLVPRYNPPFYCKPAEDFPSDVQKYIDVATEQNVGELKRIWRSRQANDVISNSGKCWKLSAAGFPLNPNGRTGMAGRGNHPRFGANRRCFYIVLSGGVQSTCQVLVDSHKSVPNEWHLENSSKDEHLTSILKMIGISDSDAHMFSMRRLDTSIVTADKRIPSNDTSPARLASQVAENENDTDNAWTEHDVWAISLRERRILPTIIGYSWLPTSAIRGTLPTWQADLVFRAKTNYGL
uniref:Protein transport protein sec16 n=1 Tax=Caenorhabditis japonica TaxID=281687 RepID=A0A8R1EDE1_CAEJA